MAGVVVVDASGDLVLRVADLVHDGKQAYTEYRVDATTLRSKSPYFKALLDPTSKFVEGSEVASKLAQLKLSYPAGIATAPASVLPSVVIEDAGPFVVADSTASTTPVMTTFFNIVHGLISPEEFGKETIEYAAYIVAVSDRFMAKEAIKDHMRALEPKKLLRTAPKTKAGQTNEWYWRQRIFIGYMMEFASWVESYSRLLIDQGSELWSTEENEVIEGHSLPWMHLPGGIEEELYHRRQCILTTVGSLQEFFLAEYTSGKRQCRLGYDSSAACDSFQLGEMIRFFSRRDLLSLRSSIPGQDYSAPYAGALQELFKVLKQSRTYQLDSNHVHCGLRTAFIPRLEVIESIATQSSKMGICLTCWNNDKSQYSWLENPMQGTLKFSELARRSTSSSSSSSHRCSLNHAIPRRFFTAQAREWLS